MRIAGEAGDLGEREAKERRKMSMTFEGTPLYIEFNAEGHVFAIVTWSARHRFTSYDVDWCDAHGHHHAQENGGASFPLRVSPRHDEQGTVYPTRFWAAPHVALAVQEPCHRLSVLQLLVFLLEDEQVQEEWLGLAVRTREDLLQTDVPFLFSYWSDTFAVEEGEIVYCAHCRMSFDYEQEAPCRHLYWCNACGHFSHPPGAGGEECPHRSPDGERYIDPRYPDPEDVAELWRALAAVPLIGGGLDEPDGLLAQDFFDWRSGTPWREVLAWFEEHALGGMAALMEEVAEQ